MIMVIPRKDPELLLNIDLRIPVTKEQKTLIQQASEKAGIGRASWCRQVLLKAAREETPQEKGKKSRSNI
jgi:hypothetical protein